MNSNRTYRRVLQMLAVLALLFAACGSSDNSGSAEGTDVDEEATTAESVTTEPAVEETTPETTEAEEEAVEEEPEPEPEVAGGVIGFAYGLDDAPIYQNVLAPALAEADRLGFEIVEGAAASNCETQLGDIDNMIASGVDALVITSICPGGYDAQIGAAQAADIAVVTYLWDHPDADGRILLADEIPGQMMADALIDWYDNDFTGTPEEFSWIAHGCSFAPPNIQLRTVTPIELVTAHTGVAPVETDCLLAPPLALDGTLEILQAEPGIDAVLGLVDGASYGSYLAFEQAEGFDSSNVFIAGVDGELQAIELISQAGGTNGMYALSAALDLEAVGFSVVRVAQAAIAGDAANSTFSSRHVPITTGDVDGAGEWFDRVFEAYGG